MVGEIIDSDGIYAIARFDPNKHLDDMITLASRDRWTMDDAVADRDDFFIQSVYLPDTLYFIGLEDKDIKGFLHLTHIETGRNALFGGYAKRKSYHAVIRCSRLVIKYAFEILQLERLTAVHCIKNRAATLIDLKLGFSKEGVIRNAFRVRDRFYDTQIMGFLKKEWENGH